MKKDSNTIKFERNRLFKSKILTYLFSTITVVAIVFLANNTLDHIMAYFLAEWTPIGFYDLIDITRFLFLALLLQFLMVEMSCLKVNTTDKTIKIRNLGTWLIPIKKNILDLEKVEVFQKEVNLILYFKEKRKVVSSVKDCTKFVKLLQDINPAIEVEYR